MSKLSAGNLGVRGPADSTASRPGEMTQLFAAIMSPTGETAGDAASSRGTSLPRVSLPIQAVPINPSTVTTAAGVVAGASPASEAETQTLKIPDFQGNEATTQNMAEGIADSGIGSPSEPESALPSILKRQGDIAKMFAISDSEPREWEWHEAMEAVSPGEGEGARAADSDLISSPAASMPIRSGDGMTELLHTLDGSARFMEAPKLDARPEAPVEFAPLVRASQPGEESLRGTSQPSAAPSPVASRFLPMLLVAIAVLLVANLVAMLMKH